MKYGILDEVGCMTLDDEAFAPRGRYAGQCYYGKKGGGGAQAAPPPPEPVPVPTVDEAAVEAESNDKMRRRKGQASTILAGGGDLVPPSTQTGAKLLGQ